MRLHGFGLHTSLRLFPALVDDLAGVLHLVLDDFQVLLLIRHALAELLRPVVQLADLVADLAFIILLMRLPRHLQTLLQVHQGVLLASVFLLMLLCLFHVDFDQVLRYRLDDVCPLVFVLDLLRLLQRGFQCIDGLVSPVLLVETLPQSDHRIDLLLHGFRSLGQLDDLVVEVCGCLEVALILVGVCQVVVLVHGVFCFAVLVACQRLRLFQGYTEIGEQSEVCLSQLVLVLAGDDLSEVVLGVHDVGKTFL